MMGMMEVQLSSDRRQFYRERRENNAKDAKENTKRLFAFFAPFALISRFSRSKKIIAFQPTFR
jgi:hypothetical protein